MSDHSSCLLGRDAVDAVDEVAGNFSSSRLDEPAHEEKHVERALGVHDHLFGFLVRKGQAARAFIEAINETHVACFCIAKLVDLKRLILEPAFIRHRREQVPHRTLDVSGAFRTDVEVEGSDVQVTLYVDRIAVDCWLDERTGVTQGCFVGPANIRVLCRVPAVAGQPLEQRTEMPHEGSDGFERDGKQRRTGNEHAFRDRAELRDDASFRDALDDKTRAFLSGIAPILICNSRERSGEIENIEREVVFDLDPETRRSLAHLLGPQRYVIDESELNAQFHLDGSVSLRSAQRETVA